MVLKNYLKEQGLTIGQIGEDVDVQFGYYSDTNGGIEACKNGEYDIVLTNSSLGYYAEKLGVDVVARGLRLCASLPLLPSDLQRDDLQRKL